MDPSAKTIVTELLPMLVGGIGTSIAWVVKAMFKARCDLDVAHDKIRDLEQRLYDIEQTYSEGD